MAGCPLALFELGETKMNEFKLIVAGGRDFNDECLMVAKLLNLVESELADKEEPWRHLRPRHRKARQ